MKKLKKSIPYMKSTRRNTIRLVLLFALVALASLSHVTVWGQGFSKGFDDREWRALQDTATKFEYLKRKSTACDTLVSALRSELTATQISYRYFRKGVTVQAELDSVASRQELKVEKKASVKKGRRQGAAVVVVLEAILATILIIL